MMLMLVLGLFSWWYSQGWLLQMRKAQRRFIRTALLFSTPILLRTLFSPWRRIITYPGASLDAKLRAVIDNLVSRVVGFFVRLIVLISSFVALLAVAAIGLIIIVAWPLIPVAILGLLAKAAIG